MARWSTAMVLVLLVLAATASTVTYAQDDGGTRPAADNTVIHVDLQADGTAMWAITYRTALETDEDRVKFERFRDELEDNPERYLGPFRQRMTGVVADAPVDRETGAVDFRVVASIQEVPDRWGVVRFEFTWIGFARGGEDRLHVGDVFGSGFYLEEGDAMEISAPDGHVVETAEPSPDSIEDDAVRWRGRRDFDVEEPAVTVVRRSVAGSAEGRNQTPTDGFSLLAIVGVVLLLGLLGLVVARRRQVIPVRSKTDDVGGSEPPVAADDPEGTLLADEDRLIRLLESEGGRIKQAEVASRLDWSTSKTSRVISRMHEEGSVRKYRLGRENVVALPDDDPTVGGE